MTLEEKVDLALSEAQQAEDFMEIQNLVSAHLYCYRAQEQYFEIENFWAKERDDLVYAEAYGREAVVDFYCATNQKMRNAKIRHIKNFYPEIEVCKENDGMGDMVAKASTTPFVTIANDGQSARGIWFSPGICSEVGPDGNIKATYFQEKIGLDFVKEREGWRILSLKIYPELIINMPHQIFDEDDHSGRTFDLLHTEDGLSPPPPPETFSKPYGPTAVAKFNPPLPKSYDTWDNSQAFKMG